MAATSPSPEPADWARRLAGFDRRLLSRALTAVENQTPAAAAILRDIAPVVGRARVVGVTGPPGAGKSTLVGGLIHHFRERELRVGVLAVDPSSVTTGGAILGDRIRMQHHGGDDGVFVRSLASRGHLGGLSLHAVRAVDVMDAAGMDVIIVETVGTGQSEIEIAEIADPRIVVVAPGLGDEVQALKAGVLEIADLLVVNKCDLPYADRCENDLRQMLGLRQRGRADIPILKVTATRGDGLAELANSILELDSSGASRQRGLDRILRLLATEIGMQARQTASQCPRARALAEQVLRAESDLNKAARDWLQGDGKNHD